MKKIVGAGVVLILGVLVFVVLLPNKGVEEGHDHEESDSGVVEEPVTSDDSVVIIDNRTDGTSGDSAKESAEHQEQIVKKLRELKMSPAVRTIISFDGDGSDRKARFDAMKKLTRTLQKDDIEALKLFLDMRFEDQENLGKMRLITFNAIKNNALEVIVRQKEFPEDLSARLVDMFNDEKHDTMWRDYCVQYFAACYKNAQSAEKPDGQSLAIIEESYWKATEQRDTTLPGTSLLALERLSSKYPRIKRKKVEEMAVDLVNDDNCLEASKITALRVAAKMKKKEVLPTARVIAQVGDTVMLRMAAIATLGDIGEAADVELLESFSASEEPRISNIAKSAYKRLSKSLEKGVDTAANK